MTTVAPEQIVRKQRLKAAEIIKLPSAKACVSRRYRTCTPKRKGSGKHRL